MAINSPATGQFRAKKVYALTIDKVPRIFDGPCMLRVARIGKPPPNADLKVFATILRHGLQRYAQFARAPSSNAVHQHIKALEKAASRGRYNRVADLLWSPLPAAEAARDCLSERLTTPAWRGRGVTLPSAVALRDPNLRMKACELIQCLCTVSAKPKKGRLRSTGKQSRSTIEVEHYGPIPSPHFSKRDAEYELITALQDACLRAGWELAKFAWTTNPGDPGPFARMAQEVLDLAGGNAKYADAVGLINELNKRRGKKNPDWRKLLTPSLSTNNS